MEQIPAAGENFLLFFCEKNLEKGLLLFVLFCDAFCAGDL